MLAVDDQFIFKVAALGIATVVFVSSTFSFENTNFYI